MSRQKLLAYPYIDEVNYKEKIDPYKLNLMLRSIEESVLRSVLRGSELTELLTRLNLGVETSYIAMSKHIGTLLSYDAFGPSGAFACAFGEVDLTSGGNQDKVAGIVTLNWDKDRRYSKIPRFDTNDDGIPDTVSPAVSIYVNGTKRSEEDQAYNALNRRNDSFWVEQITPGSNEVQILLPASINKLFNYIEIAPFPVFGVNITEVSYQDSHSDWHVLYDTSMNAYKFYNNSGPLVMHVSPRETNGTFKITCNVDASIGTIGFSNIDIGLIDYKDEIQTAYLKFENAPANIITLSTLDLDFYVDNVKADKFVLELAITNSTDGSGSSIPVNKVSTDQYIFGSENIDATNGLWLKVVMKEVNRTSPVIRGCKLGYEV